MTSSKASRKLGSQSRIEASELVCNKRSNSTCVYMCFFTNSQVSTTQHIDGSEKASTVYASTEPEKKTNHREHPVVLLF